MLMRGGCFLNYPKNVCSKQTHLIMVMVKLDSRGMSLFFFHKNRHRLIKKSDKSIKEKTRTDVWAQLTRMFLSYPCHFL